MVVFWLFVMFCGVSTPQNITNNQKTTMHQLRNIQVTRRNNIYSVEFKKTSDIFGSFNAELNFKQFSLHSLVLFDPKIETYPGQCGPGSDGNEGVLCIYQSSSITEASPSDCLLSYLGHSLGESYRSRSILQPKPTGPVDTWLNLAPNYKVNIYVHRDI